MKYMEVHSRLPFWERSGMKEIAGDLMEEPRDVMEAYVDGMGPMTPEGVKVTILVDNRAGEGLLAEHASRFGSRPTGAGSSSTRGRGRWSSTPGFWAWTWAKRTRWS
jgi:hypothetical protein